MTATRERTLFVGEHRVHVRECGEGRPLLLVNGIGAHLGMWRPLERALPDVRVIAYDAPGTGRSPRPAVPLSFGGQARLAEQVLDELGHDRVDVLGYSFGGITAQHLARRAPRRVRRLVLAATTPGWGGVSGSVRAMSHMATPLRYYSRRYYERAIGEIAGGRARTDRAWLERHGQERRAHPPHPLGYAWQLAALCVPPGSLPWLHTLTQPTLVVCGDDDPILPVANSMLLAHRIPHARLLVAPGEGHLLLLDAESAAVPVMREFLVSGDPAVSDARQRTVKVDDAMVRASLRGRGVPVPHAVWALNTATRALFPARVPAPDASAEAW